jgi:signal peptidase II
MGYIMLFIVLLIGDQASKYWARTVLYQQSSIQVIPHILRFTYVENRGAAFGMLQGQKIFFVIMTFLLIGLFFVYLKKTNTNKCMKWTASIIIAGAIGNLIDRVLLGYVVDFIDFHIIWRYVFNVADIYVVGGTLLLALQILLQDEKEKETSLSK